MRSGMLLAATPDRAVVLLRAARPGRAARGAPLAVAASAASSSEAPSTSGADYVELGQIGTAHGIKGDVKVYISTDAPKQRFATPGKTLFLRRPANGGPLPELLAASGELLKATTESARPRADDVWLVKFKEVPDRTQAERLQGCTVLISAAAREPLKSKDEFYVTDLIGCKVYHKKTGWLLGIVTDVFDGTGTHDTMVVQLRQTADDVRAQKVRSCYVPFAKAICPVVDVSQKRLEVLPPAGLLDLTVSKPVRRPLTPEQQEARIAELQAAVEQEGRELAARGLGQAADEGAGSDDDEDDEASARAEAAEEEAAEAEAEAQKPQRPQRQRPGVTARPRAAPRGAGAGPRRLKLGAGAARRAGAKPADDAQ